VEFEQKDIIYENPLASSDDIDQWRMEGDGAVSFPQGRMRLEGTRDPGDGQAANIVFWCPEQLPDHLRISWEFYPLRDPGLCILFYAAGGNDGRDLFDPSLAPRQGPYNQYHHGDINAMHVSYYRYKHVAERAFSLCNLRKSYGFHMVAQAPGPIPTATLAMPPYRITVTKAGPVNQLHIGQGEHPDLLIYEWVDDGQSTGPVLEGGKIGFRQMTPMLAEYANLVIHRVAQRS
jgi:hypothetical protein